MIDYILTYLAIGFVVVATFPKPLRFKISNFRFISIFDNVPRWKVVTFAVIGVSVAKYSGGGAEGLGLFVPITDALESLNVKLKQ